MARKKMPPVKSGGSRVVRPKRRGRPSRRASKRNTQPVLDTAKMVSDTEGASDTVSADIVSDKTELEE